MPMTRARTAGWTRTLPIAALALGLAAAPAGAQRDEAVSAAVAAVQPQVVSWRRDIHEHPELSNREHRTAALVAEHLESLGLEVRTGIAHTGVIGVLRGARPGPVVALRADMDALPVTEQTGLPFASRVRTSYLGREVGVMHACGHDAHTAILMGAAQVLAGLDDLPGTVLFVFQPAEEGAPPGEEGGADLMLAEGAFDDPKPEAVFGLHVVPQHETGTVAWTPRGAMASSDRLRIVVRGRQTHAAYPWLGVDPIHAAARVVLALHAIPARRVDTRVASVVSIGAIHGGVRSNIIPDEVELLGTIRALSPELREAVRAEVRRAAGATATAAGASAEVEISPGYPITWNDPDLAERMLPTLERAADGRVERALPRTGAEDFAYFSQRAPGLYVWLGVRPPGVAPEDAAPNHSPHFVVDESALPVGVRTLSLLAVDYLEGR
ncbi:MAG: amidohydrolase [Myxococcota bacterium]|nr:amidohydrolase [Myxococcota bacterium]